jgi:predicted short-subunit dehydrogenase-like oxidoreductase (DUF2520 family)
MTTLDTRPILRTALPPLAIVGMGRAGGSIARAASAAGIDVHPAGRGEVLDACRKAEAALLCVPDSTLQDVADEVAAAVPPLRFVGHASGASGLEVLAPATDAGADAFSLHPLQTLPGGDSDIRGAACAVAGSTASAATFAEALGRALGMRPFTVREEDRAAYHAAASIASNFLVALAESASELLDRIGVDDGRKLLAPLIVRSAVNWVDRGQGALTGPIARGDEATVERQRDAIAQAAPGLLALYEALGERTRSIAEEGAGARAA